MKAISLIAMLFMGMVTSGWAGEIPPCQSLCRECGNKQYCWMPENGRRVTMLKMVPGISEPTPYKIERRRSRGIAKSSAIAPIQEGVRKPVDYAGYYIPPVPFKGITNRLHDNNAVDFRCSYGTPVVAAAAGRICRTGFNWIAGRFIAIEHENGTETFYAHLSEIYWGKGQRVRQGEVIGFSGNSGNSTAPHLHFAVHGRGAVNPFKDWPAG